ncbi:hypothetical protein DRB17_03230 [Ferruginivarius sediminum]|uniref:Uncharacterized protein n=2 Tax=Ferruginivarius sediminum TaxID=2661937 RepID=A0A369TDW6_9PROT|nr:hypothetical protein DRB17_03230 [Ferruginivarius sediminum]
MRIAPHAPMRAIAPSARTSSGHGKPFTAIPFHLPAGQKAALAAGFGARVDSGLLSPALMSALAQTERPAADGRIPARLANTAYRRYGAQPPLWPSASRVFLTRI